MGRFINADAFVSTGQGHIGYNMFAYCNNCPVYCHDSTGCYTDGQIHDFVIRHIAAWATTKGIDLRYRRMDTLIIYDHPWRHRYLGFCDIYNATTGEMWELKKNTSSYTCTTEYASNQLDNYISNGVLVSAPNLKRKLPLMSIPSGSFTEFDSVGNKYVINYWDQGNGILRYQYNVIRGNAQPYAVAGGAFIAGMIMPQLKHEWEVASMR